jgi:large subunit ribosomal protein L23
MRHVIKRPLVTEKNTYHTAAGIYVFEVDSESDKLAIRKAVEKNFKVKVVSVKTSNCRGHAKVTKFGKGKVPSWKKAFVKLAAGEKIGLFEGA